jgi:hypothetical protein
MDNDSPPAKVDPLQGQGMWGKLSSLVKNNWGKLVTVVLSGGSSGLDQYWPRLLPIPDDLRWKGVFFSLLLSIASVVIGAVIVHALLRCVSGVSRLLILVPPLIFWLSAALYSYYWFLNIEKQWKTDDVPFDLYYNMLEPIAYAVTFACLGGFIITVCFLVRELLHQLELT